MKIENNLYGFHIDALNLYLANEDENLHLFHTFTNKTFSKQTFEEIKYFTKKGNHIQLEKEHPIWKEVEKLGHFVQYDLSFEIYKEYEKNIKLNPKIDTNNIGNKGCYHIIIHYE